MKSYLPVVTLFAGGESRRMGQDKAQLPFGKMTMLEHMVRTALDAAPRVFVVGRTRPAAWSLPQVEFVPDEVPGLGPLGALQTALGRESAVLALACDLPLLTPAAMNWLIEQGNACSAPHGVVVDNGGQWEPLFSIYTRECLPLIEANLVAGRRSLHALIKAGDFAFVQAPPEISALLVNVNTPEEWAALTHGGDC